MWRKWCSRELIIDNGKLIIDNGELIIDNGELRIDNGELRIDNGKLKIENEGDAVFKNPDEMVKVPASEFQMPSFEFNVPQPQVPSPEFQIPSPAIQQPVSVSQQVPPVQQPAQAEFDINKEFQAALKAHESGDLGKAEELYRKILAVNPNHPDALHLHGVIAFQIDKHDIAISQIGRAIKINPNNPIYFHNLGSALSKQGRMSEAITCYRKVLELKADYSEAYCNLLLTLQYGREHSRERVFQEHLRWDEMYGKHHIGKILPHTNDPTPDRRLRIGYVSPDFRNHSCAYFLEPLLKAHDRTRVEIFCYAEVQRPDEMTGQIRELSDHWYVTVGKSHDEVAEQIRRDRIDILVDLAGHTAKNRLLIFVRKPAPIQLAWLGYPDTTGMAVMDYRFTDAVADPEGVADKYFTETLIRLPNGFLCYAPPAITPEVPELCHS